MKFGKGLDNGRAEAPAYCWHLPVGQRFQPAHERSGSANVVWLRLKSDVSPVCRDFAVLNGKEAIDNGLPEKPAPRVVNLKPAFLF